MLYKPHVYQTHANEHILTNPYSALFLDMGLGKTSITLTAIDILMFERFEIKKVLIIAPKKVAESTWHTEAQKWDHLKHLKFSLVLGSAKERAEALKKSAHIYVINRDNISKLVAQYGSAFPFDMVVIDELSSFKSEKSQRFKALKQVTPKMLRVVGLTGTPAPNGLIDLWPQIYLLDQGQRLGKTITSYRDNYFKPDKRNGSVIYSYKLRNNEEEIYNRIGDICISMKAKDWLELPGRTDVVVPVYLSSEAMAAYLQFERDQVLALADEEINAINAAALTNKLLQFANGAVYREDKSYYEVHTAKLERLEEDIEAANGNPILVFYQYKHDLERLTLYLKKYKPIRYKDKNDMDAWNRGEIQVMFVHAQGDSHGLNLQQGGHQIAWFGRPWSLEYYLQAVARLDRQGQKTKVINRTYAVMGTMDEDVIKALDAKDDNQQRLIEAVKAKILKHTKI